MPDGNSIQNQQWTNGTSLQNPQPPSNAVGGYTNPTGSAPPDTTGGCIVLIQGQSGSQGQNGACNVSPVNMEQQSFTFYWLAGGSGIQMTYYYTMTNGQSASATATFNITGPPSASITATPGVADVYPAGYAARGTASTPWLEFGAAQPGNVGMDFSAAVPTTGAYLWVQLVGPNRWRLLSSPSSSACTFGTGLDNTYPYDSGTAETNDSPGIALDDAGAACGQLQGSPTEGEAAETFQATMYLLWTPTAGALTPSCPDGATCTIPVPLASVTWGWNGNAIKTLNTNQGPTVHTWVVNCATGQNSPPGSCGASSPPSPEPSAYPTWTSSISNSSSYPTQ